MNILIGVTGGIAAYKSLELVRLFVKANHQVQVVMTEGAKAFIQPLSFQALSGKPVRDSLFDANQEAGMGHIELARWADVIVVAPASAETIAKLRMGRANDLLTTLCLATSKQIVIVPSMNSFMWENVATMDNVATLQQRGFIVMQPDAGEQACGEVGTGRMPEPTAIFDAVVNNLAQVITEKTALESLVNDLKKYWQGKKILLTAGPTFENIDPVRFIGNKSSGKMGFAIAEAAVKLGAEVTLIAGPVTLSPPLNVKCIDVYSAEDMFDAVQKLYKKTDFFIAVAAVADYRVAEASLQKIKKQSPAENLTLELVQNPDIVKWVANQQDKPFVVGFAAETENVVAYAKKKLQAKKLDLICANQVGNGKGFESADNQLTLISEHKELVLAHSSKKQQAYKLLEFIKELT
ncbi:MAG TPA: bifunctional phosphopantothenoylcysteine decarboxylase/phosphopantothenate--cysteine ligase CoaBC [Thiomicrospira sp.]|jgi:phosphopantothenoylcysteine decarboxylase/phosphopantothenate--cysteine ligase|nr:bifunctional phosphopantothenoylcysteine decarboxylase/phosphopantothenate--cysteine ligase CoaBC [Thiomicrospira sp.]